MADALTPEEVASFVNTGASNMTIFAHGAEGMKTWSDSFEARGGTPVFGDDALEIVVLNNDLQTWLTPERRATISRLRTDI